MKKHPKAEQLHRPVVQDGDVKGSPIRLVSLDHSFDKFDYSKVDLSIPVESIVKAEDDRILAELAAQEPKKKRKKKETSND